MTDAALRRARNRAANAALVEAYQALSADQREVIKTEFAKQRETSPTMSWPRFLAVALTLLPLEAVAVAP